MTHTCALFAGEYGFYLLFRTTVNPSFQCKINGALKIQEQQLQLLHPARVQPALGSAQRIGPPFRQPRPASPPRPLSVSRFISSRRSRYEYPACLSGRRRTVIAPSAAVAHAADRRLVSCAIAGGFLRRPQRRRGVSS
jgi:hypothetical protein